MPKEPSPTRKVTKRPAPPTPTNPAKVTEANGAEAAPQPPAAPNLPTEQQCAQGALQFLAKTPITGGEVDAFLAVRNWLIQKAT